MALSKDQNGKTGSATCIVHQMIKIKTTYKFSGVFFGTMIALLWSLLIFNQSSKAISNSIVVLLTIVKVEKV